MMGKRFMKVSHTGLHARGRRPRRRATASGPACSAYGRPLPAGARCPDGCRIKQACSAELNRALGRMMR